MFRAVFKSPHAWVLDVKAIESSFKMDPHWILNEGKTKQIKLYVHMLV